jgi:dTDP-4-amino-4,6-dideoxygalactose transaminase
VATGTVAGRLTRGEQHIAALEERLADWTGADFSLCLPQGRLGIYLALRFLIEPGQKVILSPYTIYDVVNMVICAGGRPIFADVDPRTCNIDPDQIEELIDGDTGAVLATHLQGLACDIERISEICRARRVPLIEDAAQCLGGRVHGKHVGTFGDVGIFSFSLNKNINAFFGGFLITSNALLYGKLREEISSFPFENGSVLLRRAAKCFVGDLLTSPLIFQLATFPLLRLDFANGGQVVGRLIQPEVKPQLLTELPERYKRRMTPMQASLALRQLDGVEDAMQTRLAYARLYSEGLLGLPDIVLPPLQENGSHTYLVFAIQVPNREKLVKYLMRHNSDVRMQSFSSAADLPCFVEYARDCPNARKISDRVVLLPTYPRYGEHEARKLVTTIRRYAGE